MQWTTETLAGDTEGVTYTLPVLRFAGTDEGAPTAYLQAALHAGELPGVVAVDALVPKLAKAHAEGRIRGAITIVPACNPVGRLQYHFGELQGRFHLGTRTNFNRDFPLLPKPDASTLGPETGTADQRLKQRLLALSLGHDIVLDLHCDDEGVAYLYVPVELWPAMEDCAAAMGVAAVVTWGGSSGASFDEASLHPWLHAQSDAEGLYRLLVARGVVEDAAESPAGRFGGLVAPITHVDVVTAPRAGAILFDVESGDRVAKGQRLATIVHGPGQPDGSTDVIAPQSGYILTRVSRRSLYAGDDLLKLVGDAPSANGREGALED